MQQFILIVLFLTLFITNANGQFAGGTGEEEDPYQVETLEQLQTIADSVHLDKHFIQIADIDAGETVEWNDGAGFVPIGWREDAEVNGPFTGTYNGNGYTISDLHIDRPITAAVGLFGYIVDASIENVALLYGAVSGGSNIGGTGGLVGRNNGLVSNSSSSATITGGYYTGGLVGHNTGIIIGSYATGAVSIRFAGGLVGYNYGEIINSYATGDVSGFVSGGLVGSMSHSSSKITGSYATGDVSGDNRTGGLVGMQGNGEIIGSYAEGNVTGTEDEIGGLVGMLEGTIIDSYATGDVTGHSYVGGLAGRQMSSFGRIESSYSTGDITGESYIGGLIGESRGVVIIDSYAEGMISGSSYIGGLAGWSRRSISHSYSTGEISGDSIIGGVAGFNNGDINNSFSSGSVSGKYSIGGLAGENERSITGSYATGPVSGVDYIGGLVGRNIYDYSESKIENSFFKGMVMGNNYIGGITGWNRSQVISSYFAGEVIGDSLVGGVAGWNNHTIRESFSGGKVTGEHVVGGLLGQNQEKGLVSHSYSFSDVEGVSEVGGLIGSNMDEAEVSQAYSVAQVTGSEDTGSLIGVNEATVDLSYWNTDLNTELPVVGIGSSDGMAGLTTGAMTGMAAFENLAGFDFGSKWDDVVTDRIWVLSEEYPALHWEDVTSFPPPSEKAMITSPAHELENATMPVTFRWSIANWADRYQFQLFEEEISATPVMDTTVTERSIVIEQELEYETTYVWRVRSGNDSGFTEWSENFKLTTAVSTSAPVDGFPRTFELLQNFPNPFNPSTHINFSVPEQTHVRLEVYNSLGQRVAILVDEDKNPGRYQAVFDASGLSSGLYMYRFHTPTYSESKQMLLVK